jgi:hypothetical protein
MAAYDQLQEQLNNALNKLIKLQTYGNMAKTKPSNDHVKCMQHTV